MLNHEQNTRSEASTPKNSVTVLMGSRARNPGITLPQELNTVLRNTKFNEWEIFYERRVKLRHVMKIGWLHLW